MKLRDHLYEPLETAALSDTVRFRAGSPVYDGHFPGFPITPGVLLMQTATELLEARLGRSLALEEAVNVRFLSPVVPEDIVRFSFTDGGENLWKILLEKDGIPCAKMTLRYR